MTNEMKLLTAFIEASGFDVEEVEVNPMRHDRYPSEPIIDYKVTKKPVSAEERRLTKECFNDLLDPNKSIILRYKND